MDRYFYFRTVSTLGDDDDSNDSLLVPVDKIISFQITGNTTVTVFYEPVTFVETTGGPINTQQTDLTTKDSSGFRVIKALCEATNEGPHSDGIVTIADDVTGTYLTGDITACGGITNTSLLADQGA